MNLTSEIQALKNKELKLKNHLKALVKNLPDTIPGIISFGKNCCTVSSSIIAKHGFNLSPRYYLSIDFKKFLTDMIHRSSITSLENQFRNIITTGTIIVNGRKEKIAPKFIEALKNELNIDDKN